MAQIGASAHRHSWPWTGGALRRCRKIFQTVPITKLTGDGGYRRTEDLALMIGHGWKEAFANGTRVLSEIGFAGGSGFMAYVTIGVQVGARPSRTVKAAHQSD